jgi:pimeloyl-ACP methyl ester carboxylesterase
MATLDVNGTKLEYVEKGTGEPLVLVHGSSSDYRTWNAQVAEFGTRYRTIAYSRRYHWPNERIPEGVDYSMGQHVDDLQAVLYNLGPGQFHLVGHSYGAVVCLLLAIREPALVRTLVLAEPPAITLFVSSHPKPWEIVKLAITRPRTAAGIVKLGARGFAPAAAAARRDDMDTAVQVFAHAVLGRDYYNRLSPSRLDQARANAIKAEFLGSGVAPLDDASIQSVQIPILLVSGHDSPAVFHRCLDRLEELLPRTERIEIGGASHIVHEDNTPTYNAAVLSFLASSE